MSHFGFKESFYGLSEEGIGDRPQYIELWFECEMFPQVYIFNTCFPVCSAILGGLGAFRRWVLGGGS